MFHLHPQAVKRDPDGKRKTIVEVVPVTTGDLMKAVEGTTVETEGEVKTDEVVVAIKTTEETTLGSTHLLRTTSYLRGSWQPLLVWVEVSYRVYSRCLWPRRLR